MKIMAVTGVVRFFSIVLLLASCTDAGRVFHTGGEVSTPTREEILIAASPSVTVPLPATATAQPSFKILPPPNESLYHGVFPGGKSGQEDDLTLNDLATYEEAAGKKAAWVYFSNNWYTSRKFPRETADWIREAGGVPWIRLMLRSDADQDHADPAYSPGKILAGTFDADLRQWADDARAYGGALILEYGVEVNGQWFPWNGLWNGGGAAEAYGDPTLPDGPERFRDAYRRIIDIFRSRGVDNATWVFHVNDSDWPQEDWNRFENYYPGDRYIDWLAFSAYGPQTPLDDTVSPFREEADAVYPRLAALSEGKPIVVAEFGAAARNPRAEQSAWADAALADLLIGRWPQLIGFSWWNESWQNDDNSAHDTSMRLQDNPALAGVFQKRVGDDPKAVSRLVFSQSNP